MKLYLVKGCHPTVPGQPQKATFDPAEADAFAADLVTTLRKDGVRSVLGEKASDGPPPVLASRWRQCLAHAQRGWIIHQEGIDGSGADAIPAEELPERSGADVWIEELDVTVPAARVVADRLNRGEPTVPADEGPAGLVIDALHAFGVLQAETFDGAESGYFTLADGRSFCVTVQPIEGD